MNITIDDIKSKKVYEDFNNFKLEQLKKEVKIESKENTISIIMI